MQYETFDVLGTTVKINNKDKIIETDMGKAGKSFATRDENNYHNKLEAAEEGYGGPRPVWDALREHELAHVFISKVIWNTDILPTLKQLGFFGCRQRWRQSQLRGISTPITTIFFLLQSWVVDLSTRGTRLVSPFWFRFYPQLLT